MAQIQGGSGIGYVSDRSNRKRRIYMKAINRRLLVTAGLFVAMCSLTSFNPFSQASRLAAANQEGSITLAQTSPTATRVSKITRDTDTSSQNRDTNLKTNIAEKFAADKTAPANTVAPKEDAKPIQASKVGAESKKLEGSACADGKCEAGASEKNSSLLAIADVLPKLDPEQQNVILSKYSIEEQDFIRSKSKKSELADNDEPEENICSDGEYIERIKCFEKEQKYVKTMKSSKKNGKRIKKSEQLGLLNDAISDFIEEITLDSDLSPREMNRIIKKLSRLSRGDRTLQEQVRIAQSYQSATKNADAFSNQLQRSADQIGNLDMQISQMESNPYTMQQANMLKIQRYQILNGVKSQITQFQKQYKSAIPAARTGESSLVSSLRDQMTENYQAIVSPIAGAIADQSLLTLESLPVASINPTTMPGQNGSVFGPQSQTFTPQQQIGQQQGIVYNNSNPNMTNMDVSHMTPAQQVQMRVGSLNTSANLMNNNGIANNMIPGQQQQQVLPGQRFGF